MTTAPGNIELAAEFPQASAARWQELVRGVLVRSGYGEQQLADDPARLLATTTYDGITIDPLYTAADHPVGATGLPGLAPFVRGARPEGSVSTGWDVRARHTGTDPAALNAAILADLEHGVTSIWLAAPAPALPGALAEVLLDLAPVVLEAGTEDTATALLALNAERGIPDSEVLGNLGLDPIGLAARSGGKPELAATAEFAVRAARRHPKLRTMVVDALPYHDAGGSDAQELGAAVATGVAYLRALTEAGLDVEAAARQLEFRYAVTADQFAGIAKLRAARRLWARVGEVIGLGAAAAQRQHAVSSAAMTTRRDPWVNLLRGTIACFAAGVGGADAVTVAPFDAAIGADNAFSRRIARNTQSILLEESHVAGVIDPAGGSWYLESRTEELAQRAWAVFTELERAGGIVAELASGRLAEKLTATWVARSANIATRTDPITGVTEFPNLAEDTLIREPVAVSAPSGGLPVRRWAGEFETLRDRSDAVLAETGARPKVFLATIGPVAAHTARAGFAANLLQAGGIDTPRAGATSEVDDIVAAFRADGAGVACICGSDRSYGEQAQSLAAALKQAGATRVLLAGPRTEEYAQAGVDDFLYRGCDALQLLRGVWNVLEANS